MDTLENNLELIKSLYETYKGNEFMLNKIDTKVKQLPRVFTNICELHEKRQIRANSLSVHQREYIDNFIRTNRYYYLQCTEQFICYDKKHYRIVDEDDIIHHIFETIESPVSNWKFKTVWSVLKAIRSKTVLTSIPDSFTIQHVLNHLYPVIFKTKEEVKYFLCVLGEIIFRDKSPQVYFVTTSTKDFVRNVEIQVQRIMGSYDICSRFKTKYFAHEFANARIIHTQPNFIINETVEYFLKHYILDIICVACHYRIRNETADNYINKCHHFHAKKRITYLVDKSGEAIIREFANEMLENVSAINQEKSSLVSQIHWKNMQYLWKLYLEEHQLPNIVYLHNLKDTLKTMYDYDETSECFNGITSKHLPLISSFLQFFEASFCPGEDEFEISEIIQLYYDSKLENLQAANVLEQTHVVRILSHFQTNYSFQERSFHSILNGLHCHIWNKRAEVKDSYNDYKAISTLCKDGSVAQSLHDIDMDEIYMHYSNSEKYKYIAGKNYYEMVINELE